MATFALKTISFTTITRLTLVFNETLDATDSNNTDPANYTISGDVTVNGNFSISGSSVSFDIGLAAAGRVYDITVTNIVSAQGNVIVSNQMSFFYGVGSITPMLVYADNVVGSLYILSDSALVGPVTQTSTPTLTFGKIPGKSVIKSYNEMHGLIPTGGFYLSDLVTIPYLSLNVDFLFIGVTGVTYGIYINSVFVGSSTANFEGWVSYQLTLPQGLVLIEILGSNSTTPFNASLISSRFMDWQGAFADQFGELQFQVDEVYQSLSIQTVTSDDIQDDYGDFNATPRVSNYSLEVYRALLIEIIQAFKYYSATLQGLQEVIAAFTQIRPVPKWFRQNAARWILGWQHLLNREMTQRLRYAKSSFPSTNITVTGCSSSNENGIADLLFSPFGTATLQYKSVDDSNYGDPVVVTNPGTYTVVSFDGVDSVTVQVGTPIPVFPIVIPVVITGPTYPTDVTPTDVNLRIVSGALMQINGLRIQLTVTGPDPAVAMVADPTTFQHLGELFVASFWVLQSTGVVKNFVVEVSEDGGLTWQPDVQIPTPVPSGVYTRVSFTRSIGFFGVTDIRVRIRGLDLSTGDVFYLEKSALHSPQTGALYLGHNTRARSRRRKYFGYELLFFIIEPFETQAYTILGVQPSLGWSLDKWGSSPYGSPSYGYFGPVTENSNTTQQIGLLPYVIPTFVEIDSFQDTVFNSIGVVNTFGVMYEEDWRSGVIVNFDVVPQSPDRFSYLAPSTPSTRKEVVIFDGTGLAVLSRVSTQDQDISQLLKNGMPIPNNEWYYVSSTEIQFVSVSSVDQNAIWTFTYEALFTFESAIIDLGANFALFNWYADWYEYNRCNLVPILQPITASLIFSLNTLTANLLARADTTASGSILSRTINGVVTTVSNALWSFVNPGTVKLDSSEFDVTATYSLQYTSESLIKKPVVTSTTQVQYSVDGSTFSPWITITADAPFGNRFRYFKFQTTVSNIMDLRDYKLRSLVMKGDPLDRDRIQGLV